MMDETFAGSVGNAPSASTEINADSFASLNKTSTKCT